MEVIRYPCSNIKLCFWLQEPLIQISGNFVSHIQWQEVASCQCFGSAAISFFILDLSVLQHLYPIQEGNSVFHNVRGPAANLKFGSRFFPFCQYQYFISQYSNS